jgi:IS5 family transposase
LLFGGKLNKENRWVKLPCVRVAWGALIIHKRLKSSERETVQHIAETLSAILPWLSGVSGRSTASLMTHFCKRLGPEIIYEVNERIVKEAQHQKTQDSSNDDEDDHPQTGLSTSWKDRGYTSAPDSETHKGKLLLDASTCASADIAYSSDLTLLNEAREKLEHIIDVLFEPLRGTRKKPRTYRKKAHRANLAVAKQRRPKSKTIRKAIGQQLRYVKRNMHIIERLKEHSPLILLNKQEYRQLLVISELYRQQR